MRIDRARACTPFDSRSLLRFFFSLSLSLPLSSVRHRQLFDVAYLHA